MPFPDIPQEAPASLFMDYLTAEEMVRVRECYDENSGNWVRKEELSEEQEEELRMIFFNHNQIVVADNGSGMTFDTVKSAWMYIGTSDKEYNVVSPKGRIKTGAKGIGRFALDKLSRKSVMYTRADKCDSTIKWQMDWDQFVNTRLLKDIQAEIEETNTSFPELIRTVSGKEFEKLKEYDWSTGTLIILTPLREPWSMRLFERVNSNLQSINPIGSVDKFRVAVHNQLYPEKDFTTKEVAISEEDYDYRIQVRYDGDRILHVNLLRNEVNIKKKTVTIAVNDKSVHKELAEFWARKAFQTEGYRREDYSGEVMFEKNVTDLLAGDSLNKIRMVGPFEAELFFLRRDNNEYELMKRVAVLKRRKLIRQF